MSSHDRLISGRMPAAAPLRMPTQDFARPFKDPRAKGLSSIEGTTKYRIATFVPAFATTAALLAVFADWFRKDGFALAEIILLALVGFSTFWIALSVAASTIGLLFGRKRAAVPEANSLDSLDVALLVPVYNEDPEAVFARIKAMRDELASTTTKHRFAFFILSDTRDDLIALREIEEFDRLRRTPNGGCPIFYRRRSENLERKTGNIRDWIENWGDAWQGFVTLDADSLMSAKTLTNLADELAVSPEVGLIQTVPRLLGAKTVFAKVQQFANNIYSGVLANGLERWSGNEGNYWGHNAIIRTKAFAACAGLPKLTGNGALGGTIKSHDFVEAALLRRSGWAVRLVPSLVESYEETPQTIVDYVQRDRRWCQGNLQHMRLLSTAGLAPASRFHMLQGAMAYIASVTWFVLLLVWAVLGRGEDENVIRYFTDTNPLFPQWPEMDMVNRIVVLCFIFGLLLTPKLFGIAHTLWKDPTAARLGGHKWFALSAISEILLSFILAPIMMVQHVTAVMRTLLGRDAGWAPQNRAGSTYSLSVLLRFHWLETLTGTLLLTGIGFGVVSLWLLPIAISLAFAVGISFATSIPLTARGKMFRIMATQEDWSPTRIITQAGGATSIRDDSDIGSRRRVNSRGESLHQRP